MPAIAPVVPSNIDRAKRIAKKLQQIYRHKPLAACQATTAHLLFHKDWHGLEEAVKNKLASAPLDEALPAAELKGRIGLQWHTVCRELGEVDPDKDYNPPKEPPTKESYTEQELGVYLLEKDRQKPARLAQAAGRYQVLLAQEVIFAINPSSQLPNPEPRDLDRLTIGSRESIASLPARLGRWWRFNIQFQPVVADALESYPIDPDSPVSLLQFGAYWGELCFHYADTVDWMMGMGVSYLLAERFGWLKTVHSSSFMDLLRAFDSQAPKVEQDRLTEEVNAHLRLMMGRFYHGFPRDDFAGAFEKQPGAFQKNARTVLNVLDKPQSRRGIWKHDR